LRWWVDRRYSCAAFRAFKLNFDPISQALFMILVLAWRLEVLDLCSPLSFFINCIVASHLTVRIFPDLHQAYGALLFDTGPALSLVPVPLVLLADIAQGPSHVIPYQTEIPLVPLCRYTEPSSKVLLGSQKYQKGCLNGNNYLSQWSGLRP
jgi:hypothetical protein